MDTCTCCGAEVVRQSPARPVCPACLLRLALEPDDAEAPPADCELPRLLGPIGRGPHGTAYLGYRDHDEPRLVTIKLIEERIDVDRFSDRIRDVANRLRAATSPEIRMFLEPGVTTDRQPYVLSAFVPGTSLAHYGTRLRGDPAEALRLLIRLCTLVANLHGAGIVHGSIKSSNIIVSDSHEGPVPVLLDTGVVPAIEDARRARVGARAADPVRDVRDLQALVQGLLEGAGFRPSDSLGAEGGSAADLVARLTALST